MAGYNFFIRFLIVLLVFTACLSLIAGLSLVEAGRYWEALPCGILIPLSCRLAGVLDSYC